MKRLLVDTNVVLWMLRGDRGRVSKAGQQALEDDGRSIFISAVSRVATA